MLVVGGAEKILHKVAVAGLHGGNAFAAAPLLLVVVQGGALYLPAPG
jgi:hypothetical protein